MSKRSRTYRDRGRRIPDALRMPKRQHDPWRNPLDYESLVRRGWVEVHGKLVPPDDPRHPRYRP